jgi:GGDEF domain-containing protein
MDHGVPRRRRARPVGDAPVDALLARSESLTKGWLVELVERMPLEDAGSILAAEFVQDGPSVCDAVVRALADDMDLRRLEPGGALEHLVARIGEMAGVSGPAAVSNAVDALRSVVWNALRDELPNPDPQQIAELAERLGLISELVRTAALGRSAGPSQPRRPLSAVEDEEPRRDGPPAEPEELAVSAPPAPPERPPAAIAAAAPVSAEPRIRGAEALWIGAFEEEIERCDRAGTPLALLLVEMEDGERVRDVESPPVATATLGRFAQAVRDAVRRPDIIASESDTRTWVIASETGRSGAQALASRLSTAVRGAEPWRGAPMAVTIGVGVLGEDGRDADSLIAAAEESRFAAAASGVDVVRSGFAGGD